MNSSRKEMLLIESAATVSNILSSILSLKNDIAKVDECNYQIRFKSYCTVLDDISKSIAKFNERWLDDDTKTRITLNSIAKYFAYYKVRMTEENSPFSVPKAYITDSLGTLHIALNVTLKNIKNSIENGKI